MEMMKLQLKLDDPSAAGLIEWWIENVAPKNLLRTDNTLRVFREGLQEHRIVSVTVLNAILSVHQHELDYRGATTVEKIVEVERKETDEERRKKARDRYERLHAEGLLTGEENNRTEWDREEPPVAKSTEDLRAVANRNPDREVVAKLIRSYSFENLMHRPVLSVTNFRKDLLGRIVVEDSNGIVNWTKTRKAVETKIKEFTRDYSKAIKEVTDAEQKRVAEVKSQRPVETVVEEEEEVIEDTTPLPAVPRGCPAPNTLAEVRAMGPAYGRAMTATWGKQFEARVNEIIRRSGARTLPMQQFLR